ncbi:ABC transporter permease/M1 family aminopeptidase [Xanthocytophaga flavus]|nr:M1 family aminopeptidase [Xanthocytophaga flavus]
MLIQLIIFEWRYHFRQISFKIAVLLFFVMGFISVKGGFGGEEVYKNSPYAISVILSLFSLFLLFGTTVFAANVVLRDSTHKMDSLVYATSISKFQYLISRFAGLLLPTLFILFMIVMGMLLGLFLVQSAYIGPFHSSYYFYPLLELGIPNILFNTTVIFAVALLTRSSILTYIAGVGVYILYMVASILGNSPLMASSTFKSSQDNFLSVLLDPYGLVAFFGTTRFWSSTQRNTQLLSLEGSFLANRLLWIGLSLLLFALTCKLASFRILPNRRTKHKSKKEQSYTPTAYNLVLSNTFLPTTQARMFIGQTWLSVKQMFGNIAFIAMLVLWVFYLSIEVSESMTNGAFGISFYPTTSLIVNEILETKPAILILLFYSMELLWYERTVKTDALIDTTPVSNLVLFLSKVATMAFLVVTLIVLNCLTGIGVQLFHNYYTFECSVYLSLLYYSGLPLFLIGLLIIVLQLVIGNKYLGMIVSGCLLLLLITNQIPGVEHYLLRFAQTPTLLHSAFNGFGHYAQAFHWYMGYWSAFMGILIVITYNAWIRGEYLSFRTRIQQAQFFSGKWQKSWLLVCLLLFSACGSYIFYQTNKVHTHLSSGEKADYRASYEKKYKQYAALPQPIITDVKTTVDLYPELREYHVKGSYQLQNKTSVPIQKVLVWLDSEVGQCTISLQNVHLIKHDSVFHHYWLQFDKPLQPGQKTTMQFSLMVNRSGFTQFNNENSVVSNGSYIELEKYLPLFGYAYHIELENPIERSKRGLTAQRSTSYAALSKPQYYNWVHYETIVSTSKGQKVVTVGNLQKEWQQTGRSYFHYKTDQTIAFSFALSSANYQEAQTHHKGIQIKAYYLPGQSYNVASMLESVRQSLDYYQQAFGPYQHKQLCIAEIPQYRGAATAYPGILFTAETVNFLADYSDGQKTNYSYTILAHEMAHEWWAHQLEPASLPGSKVLTETLAEYSETLLTEKKYGKNRLQEYLGNKRDEYFAARGYAGEKEVPLDQVTNQTYLYYYKGAIVMHALKESIGPDKLNQALQALLRKYTIPHRQATTQDLVNELYTVTPDSLHTQIDEWFRKIVFYDLSISYASYHKLADGRFQIDMNINIQKSELSNSKKEVAMKIHEQIPIGVFSCDPDKVADTTEILYLKSHPFHQPTNRLSFIVNKEPHSIVLDPYITFMDKNKQNNLYQLTHKK